MHTEPAAAPAASAGPARWRFALDSGLWLSDQALHWLDLIEPAAMQWKSVLTPRLAVTDRPRLVEALLRALDGEPLDVQTATLECGDSARLLRWIADGSRDGRSLDGMLLDVSRDAREREALLELAGLQRSFIDALHWPACAYDEAGDIVLANRLWRRCADCTIVFDGHEVALPDLPEWICRERGDFHSGGASERQIAVILRSSEGEAQQARIHRSVLRQAGTPLNVLSIESRPVAGSDTLDQDEAVARGR